MDLIKSFHSPFFKHKSSPTSPSHHTGQSSNSNSNTTSSKPKLFRKNTLRKRSSPPRISPIPTSSTSSPASSTSSSLSSAYYTTKGIMGQQNSKPDSNEINNLNRGRPQPFVHSNQPSSAFSSPGPDPFHHSLPPSHLTNPLPAFYHAPHSAPVVPVSIKPKGLIRSLSAKRKGESRRNIQNVFEEGSAEPELPPINSGSIKALKTLGHHQFDLKCSMKEFEALVQKAELDAGLTPSSPFSPESSTLTSKSKRSIKRTSINEKEMFKVKLQDNSPLPKLSATPAYLRPTPYNRRNSSSASSIHSSRVSIKSARRAEREWRAKVSALSSGLTPSTSNSPSYNHISPKAPMRIKGGPVPPKRSLGYSSALSNSDSQTSRSPSPLGTEEGTVIITPPHTHSTSFSTPLSNRSFETLGHYPNSSTILESPTPANNNREYEDCEEEGIRERKPSVPHSAYSSVYSTLKNEDGLARPISFASGQWLAPVHSSPLKIDITSGRNEEGEEEENQLFSPDSVCAYGTPTPTSDTPHTDKLPPFESFKSSPRMVISADLPNIDMSRNDQSSSEEDEVKEGTLEKSEVHKKHQSLPSPPRPTALQSRRPSLHIPSLNIPSSPPTLPPLVCLQPLSAPSSPSLVTPTRPILSTPSKDGRIEEPSTPYSPTTAFILSAPSPSIDQLAFSTSYGAFVPSPIKKPRSTEDEAEPITPVKKHPFTFGAKPSPEVVVSMNREPSDESSESIPSRVPQQQAQKPFPSSNNTGISIIPRRSSIDPFIPRQLPSTIHPTHHPVPEYNALRPKDHLQNIPSIKSNIVGNSSERYMKEYGTGSGLKRLGKNKVDLTPGMENGCRPPKSGLPMDDLARWLQNTSV